MHLKQPEQNPHMRPWQEFHFHQFRVKGLSPGKQETDHEYPACRLRATDWLLFYLLLQAPDHVKFKTRGFVQAQPGDIRRKLRQLKSVLFNKLGSIFVDK
jgi:hypothetical protein